jgi:hypothetical protein
MKGIMADINVKGQMRMLLYILESDGWKEIWTSLNLSVQTFADLGLSRDAPDSQIWHTCQREDIILLTNNRNADGPDSLEETIRLHNKLDSLPVFTFADSEKIRQCREYAEEAVESLLEYLLDIDGFRGTGRLFLP